MEWTVRFYMHKAHEWQAQREYRVFSPGHVAYANEQISLWNELGRVTETKFAKLCSSYTKIWLAALIVPY